MGKRAGRVSPRIGLVLSSGELRGSAHLGVWAFLRSQNWERHIVTVHGTSIGSLVACGVRQGNLEDFVRAFVTHQASVSAVVQGGNPTFNKALERVSPLLPAFDEYIRSKKAGSISKFIESYLIYEYIDLQAITRRSRPAIRVGVVVGSNDDEVDEGPFAHVPDFEYREDLEPRLKALAGLSEYEAALWLLASCSEPSSVTIPVIDNMLVADGCLKTTTQVPTAGLGDNLDLVIVSDVHAGPEIRLRSEVPLIKLRFKGGPYDLEIDTGGERPADEVAQEVSDAILSAFDLTAKKFVQFQKAGKLPTSLTIDPDAAERMRLELASWIESETRCEDCEGCGQLQCGTCDGERLVDCETCTSSGSVECPECDGTSSQDCDDCDGDGETDCGSCEGAGDVECDSCDGEGTLDCDECDGDGEVECPRCDGSGERANGSDCKACSGSGTKECKECDGLGSQDCDDCDGGGDSPCSDCEGNGTCECDSCAGQGATDCENCEGGHVGCDDCTDGKTDCEDCDADGAYECEGCDGTGMRPSEAIEAYSPPRR